LQHLSARKYGGRKLQWQELFPKKIANKTLAAYIMDRTLHRPRDFLAYVNLCLQAAEGRSEVTVSIVREVEREYSIGRHGALIDEWKGAFPSLPYMLSFVAKFGTPVAVESLVGDRDRIDEFVESVYLDDNKRDPMHEQCEMYLSSPGDDAALRLVREMVCILYRIGAIGVRLSQDVKVAYSHVDVPSMASSSIGMDAAIRIHPMFFLALKGNARQEEIAIEDAA
jgi:hypothetical protein